VTAQEAERDAAIAGRLADELDGLAADWLTIVVAYREDLERNETVDPSDADIESTIREWWVQDTEGAAESPLGGEDGCDLCSSDAGRVRRSVLNCVANDWRLSRILAAILYAQVGP
jgi:hypothetical protein